jgi:hypothetical protein
MWHGSAGCYVEQATGPVQRTRTRRRVHARSPGQLSRPPPGQRGKASRSRVARDGAGHPKHLKANLGRLSDRLVAGLPRLHGRSTTTSRQRMDDDCSRPAELGWDDCGGTPRTRTPESLPDPPASCRRDSTRTCRPATCEPGKQRQRVVISAVSNCCQSM